MKSIIDAVKEKEITRKKLENIHINLFPVDGVEYESFNEVEEDEDEN